MGRLRILRLYYKLTSDQIILIQNSNFTMKVKEKWKWKLLSRVRLFEDSMAYKVHGILQATILEWVAFPFSRGFSQPRDRTQVPTLQVDSLPAEPQGMDFWLHRDRNKSTACRLSSKPYQWMSSHNRAASGGMLYSGKWVDVLQLYSCIWWKPLS